MLELSGLSRQEIIVIKACAPDAKSFGSAAATLVEQYSGVHLREGRSLGQPNLRNSGRLQARSGKPSTPEDGYYEEDYNEASYQPLMRKPRQGTMRTQNATEKITRTTNYPSPKQLP